MIKNKKSQAALPVAIALSLVLGMFIGVYFTSGNKSTGINSLMPSSTSYGGKLNRILNYIENEYVDTITKNQLVERAIQSMLAELDPHSYYISSENLEEYTEPLEGNFEGVGIEFQIQKDTVMVIAVTEGGPAAQSGVKTGDRIIMVDTTQVAGVSVENQTIMKLLRGPKKTKVNVKVYRPSAQKSLNVNITRGTIPVNSVDASFALDEKTGYVKVSRFGKNTYQEFVKATEDLIAAKPSISNLVIDLRNNGGGYLNAAIDITEELLPKETLIVFTKGKNQPERRYYSKKNGKYKDFGITVLINEASASASEIVAGALQDNDRATIIGRRSFGKGLVQEHLNLPDNSALRLTVARYYTPTGRCIQKPYGAGIDYENELYQRYETGEYLSVDSIRNDDTTTYKTPKGKIVYGGGGIYPDIFIAVDTFEYSPIITELIMSGNMNQFAFDYADKNRNKLSKHTSAIDFSNRFDFSSGELNELLVTTIDKTQLKIVSERELELLNGRLKWMVARHIWGNKGMYEVMAIDDKFIKASKVK